MGKGFEEATEKLGSLIVSGRAGQKSDAPAQVVESCELLGVDLARLRAVHIAGSKGKGSTSSFTERILRGAGFKTGMYTSPHLVDIRERFRIGGKVLSKDAFATYFWRAHDVLIDHHGELHFFHFLTVLGFYIFQEEKVDACIVEVGLGGRLDATNALPSPIVCGITLLDLDHQAILGNTIEEISREKAGIIKAGIPVVSIATQRPEAFNELKIKATAVGAPIFTAAPLGLSHKEGSLGLSGPFQYDNAALALSLARLFVSRTPSLPPTLPPPTKAWIEECEKRWGDAGVSRAGGAGAGGDRGQGGGWELAALEEESLRNTRWPGRAQVLEGACGGARLMLDGAHTAESLRCCAEWFRSVTEAGADPNRVRVLVFNTTGSRKGTDLLKPLATLRAAGAGGGGDKPMWDLALFVPNDSSLTSVDKVADSAVDYSWQEELVKAWGVAGGGGGGSGGGLLRAADVEGKDVAEVLEGGACRVGASIRDALECARIIDDKLGGGKVDILCTGSLYLVGDVLLRVCKDDLGSVLDL